MPEDCARLRKTQDFLDMLFNKAFEEDMVDDMATASLLFLNTYLDHPEIPDDDSKAVCCLLLVYHMKPLARLLDMLMNNTQDPLEASLNFEMNYVLVLCLQDLAPNITKGLKYKKYSDKIAKEFFAAMDKYSNIFISDKINYLPMLRDFLAYDNNVLLRITVLNISSLVRKNYPRNQDLQKFILEKVNNRSIVDMLVILLLTKGVSQANFLMDIMSLLIEINKMVKHEIIPPGTRNAIYAKIFTMTGPALQMRLLLMMTNFETDIALAYIQIFNKIDASQSLVEKIVVKPHFLKQPMLTHLLDIITSNVNQDTAIAFRACQVFKLIVKTVEHREESKVLAKLPRALQLCMGNEEMFGSLLYFIIYFEQTRRIFPDSKFKLISFLLKAFNEFNSYKVLQLIMKAVSKVAGVVTHEIGVLLCRTFNSLYEELLEVEAIFIVGGDAKKTHENSLVKICLMLESNMLSFLDYFRFEAVFVINTNHLQDTEDPMFPFFVRLQTVVLQLLWRFHVNALLDKLQIPVLPFTLKFVVDSVNDLAQKLQQLMSNRSWNLLQARSIFCSLMTLLFNFFVRPTLVKENQVCLSVAQPKISSHQMREIVKFAEHFVFDVDAAAAEGTDMEKYYDLDSQKTMLDSLSELVKNHTTLPNVTYLFKIVRHYRNDSQFKDEIELLLKFLQERNETFDHVIALVIIQFAKQKRSTKEFAQFTQAMDKFLTRLYKKEEVSKIKWHICAFLLKQLPSIIHLLPPLKANNDRLSIFLEFVRIFSFGIDRESLNKM